MSFPRPNSGIQNPELVSAPAIFGGFWTQVNQNTTFIPYVPNTYQRPITTTTSANLVFVPTPAGYYDFIWTGPARSEAPPAEYPSVGK
jgi:hypothetical protein